MLKIYTDNRTQLQIQEQEIYLKVSASERMPTLQGQYICWGTPKIPDPDFDNKPYPYPEHDQGKIQMTCLFTDGRFHEFNDQRGDWEKQEADVVHWLEKKDKQYPLTKDELIQILANVYQEAQFRIGVNASMSEAVQFVTQLFFHQ